MSHLVYVGDRVFAKAKDRGWLPGVAVEFNYGPRNFLVKLDEGSEEWVHEKNVVTERQYEEAHGYTA